MKKILLSAAALSALIPSAVMAHPGHDHSSPYSLLVHLAWIAPLVAVGALITYKRKSKQNN